MVRGIADGQIALLDEVARRHGPRIRQVAGRYLDDDQAQDVEQETLLQLAASAGRIADGLALSRWLNVVAANKARDIARSAGRHLGRVAAQVPEVPSAASMTDHVEGRVVSERLLAAVRPSDAELLIEHYVHDRPLADIAARRGTTPGTVKVMLHRSRARVRRIAREQGLAGLPGMEWVRRHLASLSPIGEAAIYGAGTLALAVGLTIAGFGDPPDMDVARPDGVDIQALQLDGARDPADQPATDGPSGAEATAETAPSTSPAPTAADPAPDSPPGADPWTVAPPPPTVRVPVTNSEIGGPKDNPDPEYTMEVPALGWTVRTEDSDPPALVGAVGTACETAGTAEPVVTCTPRQR